MTSPNKTTAIATLICLILSFTTAVIAQPASADWPMSRSDPAHNAVGTDNSSGNSVLAPTLLWKTNFSWSQQDMNGIWRLRGIGEAAVADGVVYVGTTSSINYNKYRTDGRIDLFALNATDGAQIWDYQDNESQISSPNVVNGIVYFSTRSSTHALNASNGSPLWSYPTNRFYSSPVVADGRLFVGSDQSMLALNATNGQKNWNTTKAAFFSAAVANGVVYVSAIDYKIYALDASTGNELWVADGEGFYDLACVANGVVYFSDGLNVHAFSASNGGKLWVSSTDVGVSNSAPNLSIVNESVYARNGWNGLYAINANSGDRIWNITLGNSISAPTVTNKVVYVASDSELYALNAYSGQILWNYPIGGGFASSVMVNGVIYSGNMYDDENNQFYAIAVPAITVPVPPEGSIILPIAAVSVTLAVIVVAGLLVYFKKHKRPTS